MKKTAIKVRLIPDEKQQRLLWMHAGTRRYAYNFAKEYSENYYKEHGKTISANNIGKHLENNMIKFHGLKIFVKMFRILLSQIMVKHVINHLKISKMVFILLLNQSVIYIKVLL